MDGGDGTVRLGALTTRPDRGFNLEPDVSVSSPVTRQKAAAAKQLIENHYKNYLQGLQDRKERFDSILSPIYIDSLSLYICMSCFVRIVILLLEFKVEGRLMITVCI